MCFIFCLELSQLELYAVMQTKESCLLSRLGYGATLLISTHFQYVPIYIPKWGKCIQHHLLNNVVNVQFSILGFIDWSCSVF